LPLNVFLSGLQHNWKDKTDLITEEGKQELIDKNKRIVSCDFTIVEHLRECITVKTGGP
jgi:hypothetical protein